MKYMTRKEDDVQDGMMEKKIEALKALIGRMYGMEMDEGKEDDDGLEISMGEEPMGSKMANVKQGEEEAKRDSEGGEGDSLRSEIKDYIKGFTLPKKTANLRRV